ncbi:fumarylacetoacetate hydrolase family protein [Nocardioides sp. LS1]|uniref:fumarylacetoacetate hydrolase family protein n=1 Tax=Nocardioides sp. LS1 TaxID=1027620 RepID=UPI000F618F83|nr:fumarylacetoacetate hydrolase family protein [Nocardioides sp. LS1]GCD89940.1 hydroxylase [Nocardioides sp. LS1]
MKLATAGLGDAGDRVGLVEGDAFHPFPDGLTMRAVIDGGLERAHQLAAQARSEDPVPLAQVELRVPLEPAAVRDFVAFEEHVEGVRRSVDGATGVPEAWYDAPTFYFTNPHTVIATGQPVAFPATSVARDFELEVALVVGKAGQSLTASEAVDHIFGFMLMNDWSARDIQSAEMKVGLGPAKGKDFATTLGPWIVTVDELAEHLDEDGFLDLEATVSVNGVEVGRDLMSHMGWGFTTLLAYASRDSRVRAGDVLGSGTTGGGGCLAELWGRRGRQDPPPLRDGDVVEISVQGMGSIQNVVATAAPAPTLPPVRRRVTQS